MDEYSCKTCHFNYKHENVNLCACVDSDYCGNVISDNDKCWMYEQENKDEQKV